MDINKLKHRVTIQDQRGANDGGGNTIPTWVDVATVWANVSPINGLENVVADRKRQEVSHNVTIRYRADIKPNMRLLFKGRVLTIQYIINTNEANRELKLTCLEV